MGLHSTLTFPVYGLVAPRLEPRCLAMISGTEGEEPLGITFSHGDESRGVAVTTAQRKPARAGMSQSEGDWYAGCLELLTRTDIDFRSAEAQKWRDAAEAFNADHLAHYERWDRFTWSVDGALVAARSFTIGSTWAAMSTDLSDSLLWAYGHGVEPADLALRRTDGSEYGLDLTAPLHFPDSLLASKAFGGLPDNNP